jgi:hypothetical protein
MLKIAAVMMTTTVFATCLIADPTGLRSTTQPTVAATSVTNTRAPVKAAKLVPAAKTHRTIHHVPVVVPTTVNAKRLPRHGAIRMASAV